MHYEQWWLELYALGKVDKPYVYRALLPLASQLIHYIFGGSIVIWLGVLFVGSAVFFYFSMVYLVNYFSENSYIPFVACQILFAATFLWLKPYDYATAAFFALSLGLLARRKFAIFLIVFALATLNRETAFLLIVFYAVWAFGKESNLKYLSSLALMTVIFASCSALPRILYVNNVGDSFWLTFNNYRYWYVYLAETILFVLLLRIETPSFLKVFIATVFPLQIVLHFFLGLPFEFRVFAESIPVVSVFIVHIALRTNRTQTTKKCFQEGI